jgi:hypothetical protein
MTWVFLVLPATFGEVITLEIRNRNYQSVQLFIGFMYFGAFISIWLLRAWKVNEMQKAQLDKEHREGAIRDDAAVVREPDQQRTPGRGATATGRFASLRGLWAIQRV